MTVQQLVLGFVPLLDCAPLVVALEKGFGAAEGLDLELARENSWANIRDRVIVGHFHAAHMLGPMPVASSLGIGHVKIPMIAPMALGLGGNAITVSTALWADLKVAGARSGGSPAQQGAALKQVVQERCRRGLLPLTLAMVYPFSCHNYELRYWLAACGIDPDREVQLVVLPPPFMVDALRAGQIDGFCAGEPWNSLAVDQVAGCILTSTEAIWHHSPEKVLGMRAHWADAHPAETSALVRALRAAAHWCDRPENHAELAEVLAQPHYVGESADVLLRGIAGRILLDAGGEPHSIPDFLVYADHAATYPKPRHALWFYRQMVRWGQVTASPSAAAVAGGVYRPDLYRDSLEGTRFALSADTDRALDPGGGDVRDGHDDEPRGFFDKRPD
jgi:NitT/TauT family transport system ATP-binding protein